MPNNHPAPAATGSHWAKTRRLTSWLLAIWFVMTLAVIFFARELAQYSFLGWPISFYMAAQGSVLIYVLLTAVYARSMQKIDDEETGSTDGE